MAGPNLRQRIAHGFVSRQALAENTVVEAAQAFKKASSKGLAAAPKGKTAFTIGGRKGASFFDFMFGGLAPLDVPRSQLEELAEKMIDPAGADPTNDNKTIPAGFTYLGQFIDHDITLDLTPLSDAMADPDMTKNFRSPGLDLDSVYGVGPGSSRFLFAREPNADGVTVDSPKLLIGVAEASREQDPTKQVPEMPHDLPRNMQGVALIGDHRNDENLLVAQTHLAFLRFHNAVIEHLKPTVPKEKLFEEAAKTVRWHYQWIVLNDFVRRLVEPGLIPKIITEGRKFYRFATKPFMPWEFSGAAYRLGHSMVRQGYNHNRLFRFPPPNIAPGTFNFFFLFTNLSGNLSGGMPGQGTFPSNWVIDWRRYYELPAPAPIVNERNFSRKLDTLLASELHKLPGSTPPSLALRNLMRGVQIGLPSGQDIAKVMRRKISFTPITPEQLSQGPDGAIANKHGMHKKSPLWYYILKEAQILGGGNHLGPVGSRIIAEVFIGLLQGDEGSFLAQKTKWKPTLPSAKAGDFTMADLLIFTATQESKISGKPVDTHLNPVGDVPFT